MLTVDRIAICGEPDRVFAIAADVEAWPRMLAHYRWVRILERRASGALVEMAAWRPFGPLRWPTWWVSEMTVHPEVREIRYRHVRGLTSGMDVVWRMSPGSAGVAIDLEHRWTGPRWPVIGAFAASTVIGPVFVHGIASRTLAGLKAYVENRKGNA
ncbi:MAG TPA: SRPBCC family protein [Gemmatimonadales bacterium]|jgi:ribosome-associated toxin RatA of RatAB toxin-antitoxin module|nr:SRPBCC family protein [Gemmatimonadales bacterium]